MKNLEYTGVNMKKVLINTVIVFTSTAVFAFDFGSILKTVEDVATPVSTTPISSTLSDTTVTKGLKEALKLGVDYGVKELSKKDGYLNNKSVKIPLPDNLAKAETLIRKVGGSKVADDLINSMNKAATQAAPKTAAIFIDSIDNMSLADAKKILAGDETSATEYFKKNTYDSLKKMIQPIIQESMQENKVASYYDTVNDFYKSNVKSMVDSSSVMGMAKNFGVDSYLPSTSEQNLDEYVTQKAINGLFKMIGTKETQIRKEPIAQTTSLLKQVFGN